MKAHIKTCLWFTAGAITMLFMLLMFYGSDAQEETGFVRAHPYEASTPKYLDDTIEYVSLFAKKSESSNRKIERRGILIKHPGAKATVIIAHGFMCDKLDVGFLRPLFDQCNTLTFDFRAHGELSEGQCCSFGKDEIYDVQAAVSFARSHPELNQTPLIGYGFSMGAASLIEAQGKDDNLFDALILDAPFDSTEQTLARVIDNLKITLWGKNIYLPGRGLLQRFVFHPKVQTFIKMILKAIGKLENRPIQTCIVPIYPTASAQSISKPCLFIACREDEKIPLEAVKHVFNQTQGYKKLWVTNGRHHFDSYFYNPEKYRYVIKRFIEKFLDGSLPSKRSGKIVQDRKG